MNETQKRINQLETQVFNLKEQLDVFRALAQTKPLSGPLVPTLRDQFAMAALPVVFERYGAAQFNFQLQATKTYAVADAMMEARNAKD